MRAGMIDMEVNTTLVQCYPAHEALPDGDGPFPAIVVFHDRFGLNAHTKSVASRLAREGFYVLSPDFYGLPRSFVDVAPEFMRGSTGGSFDYDQEDEASARAAELTDERAAVIARQALGYLATRARVRLGGVGLLGFSMGGRLALLTACAHLRDVRTCVAFYPSHVALTTNRRGWGGGPLADRLDALACSLLLFYGALDTMVQRPEREGVEKRLRSLGKTLEMAVFPDCGHDFFCADRDTYDISASRAAWIKTLTLFRRTLRP